MPRIRYFSSFPDIVIFTKTGNIWGEEFTLTSSNLRRTVDAGVSVVADLVVDRMSRAESAAFAERYRYLPVAATRVSSVQRGHALGLD
jgi:hypothetical protein